MEVLVVIDVSTKESGQVSENPAFRRMLNQLKLSEPVSKLDTGEEG